MIENSISRILNTSGRPVGIAFLVAPRLLLTCAHVVSAALGEMRPDRMKTAPNNSLWVDFPLSDAQYRKTRLTVKVIGWKAYRSSDAGDLAALWLDDIPSSGAEESPIRIKTDLWKHPFRAYGVPNGYDQGVWTDGEILSRQSTGYFQVQSTTTNAYSIQKGFSGSPLWSDQLGAVVGMLTEADSTPGVFAAYAIPARMLVQFVDGLQLPVASTAKSSSPTHLAINTLGEVMAMTPAVRSAHSQSYYAAAAHPKADFEDMLSGALLQLFAKQYESATELLRRLLKLQPAHGYALYLLCLTELRGQRPAAIRDYNRMRSLYGHLKQAMLLIPNNTTTPLLACYLMVDYFQRNGFSAQIADLPTCTARIRAGKPDRAELNALAHLLPDIVTFALWIEHSSLV